jgi:hypothetical protein
MTTPDCAHHWIIAPAKGPRSKGTCKLCWKKKEFQNFIPDTQFFATRDGKSTLKERGLSFTSLSGMDRTTYPEPEE